MKSTTISVDLAKNVFQVAVSRHPGKVAEAHRLNRTQFLRFFAKHKPALVLPEACGTAHFWARKIQGGKGASRIASRRQSQSPASQPAAASRPPNRRGRVDGIGIAAE